MQGRACIMRLGFEGGYAIEKKSEENAYGYAHLALLAPPKCLQGVLSVDEQCATEVKAKGSLLLLLLRQSRIRGCDWLMLIARTSHLF
jgi:hypothetical protein